MNQYVVTTPGAEQAVEADDYTAGEGLVVFRDDLGRAVVAFALQDGLRITCTYTDDEAVEERRAVLAELTELQRAESIQGLRDEVERIKRGANRQQRRQPAGKGRS